MRPTPKCTRLLDRDEFRRLVLARDGHRCVACGAHGVKLDAHHIIDRKLWDDGGYYLDNGVTLCDAGETSCHLKAEMTLLSCEDLRGMADITTLLLPEHLAQDEGERYDHWGNQIMPTGVRVRGELFTNIGCQRMLDKAGLLSSFAPYVKFPRTMHLPWSENLQNDDRRIRDLRGFEGREVVVTEKRDGENFTLYPDYYHARSIDSKDHPSRSVIRAIHAALKHEIPTGWRICGENLYARHSIAYRLKSYLEVFAIFDESNRLLGFDEMTAYCSMIGVGVSPGFENGLPVVPVLYRGPWDEKLVRALGDQIDRDNCEGYVVRVAESFHFSEWRHKVGKFVRKAHVRTDEHWMRNWTPNELA